MKQIVQFVLIIMLSVSCKHSSNTIPDTGNLDPDKNMQNIFKSRRENLIEKIGKGTVILRADYGYSGGRHEFKVASNFYYLSGFTHSGSLLVINPGSSYPYALYVTEKSKREVIYSGDIPSGSEIMKSYLADTVLLLPESHKVIQDCILKGTQMYIDNTDSSFREFILQMIRGMKGDLNRISDIAPLINEMRVIKDSSEIEEIRKAIDITGKGFTNACQICSPGKYEYEVEAMIEYTYRKYGSSMPAFESIVASGPGAVILHYSENNKKMESNDLLLMDVGAESRYYCSDITRTIPVNGKFSKEQGEIYELVLRCQKTAIDEMVPGKQFIAGQTRAIGVLVHGLYDLGLITDTISEWQKKLYILHAFSHYLGMDVHDVGDFGTTFSKIVETIGKDTTYGRILERGMVLTIEPGLYFRSNGLSQISEIYSDEVSPEEIQEFIKKVTPVYEKYKGIGVRIEDNILITNDSNVNLSKDIPKEIIDIEKLMSKKDHSEITY